MKTRHPLRAQKSSHVIDNHVQIALCGTEVALGYIHKDFVDDVVNAINKAKIDTKIEEEYILTVEQIIDFCNE